MSETIHTLHEFMVHTKGVIYLLVLGYLVGFTAFWMFLHRNEERD